MHLRAQPRVAAELLRRGEAFDVAELAADRVGEDPPHARNGHEEGHVGVLRAELAQVALQVADLRVEGVYQAERRLHVPGLRLTQLEAREEREASGPEQVETGYECLKAMRVAWMRFLSAVRCRTRWSGKRAGSRAPRTSGPGGQIAGTRFRR